MLEKKKDAAQMPAGEKREKPTPAYLREDYPYPAVGEPITDLDTLQPTGVLYEIRCPECETTIRSQGCNIKSTYEKLMRENGCVGCGNKTLVVRMVDTSNMPAPAADRD